MKVSFTRSNMEQIAKGFGTTITYKRYRMWPHVPHILDTALVMDGIDIRGGYFLLGLGNYKASRHISMKYIIAAIKHHAFSLGEIDTRKPVNCFRGWSERVGQYPPGFFTHKVGFGVKEPT